MVEFKVLVLVMNESRKSICRYIHILVRKRWLEYIEELVSSYHTPRLFFLKPPLRAPSFPKIE